jgi:hypothetical protein
MVVWEEAVTQIQVESDAKEAYALAGQLKSFNEALFSVKEALDKVRTETTSDASGRGWTGPAADAYRGYVEKIGKSVQDLHDRVEPFREAFQHCVDDLAKAYKNITVPLFNSKDLPAGTDAGDAMGDPNSFATTLRADHGRGGQWYGPGGFKRRAIDIYNDAWWGMDGAASGDGTYNAGNRAKVGWNDAWYDGEAEKKIGWWWDRNNSAATAAHADLTDSYNGYTPKIAMGPSAVKFDDRQQGTDIPGGPGSTPGGFKPPGGGAGIPPGMPGPDLSSTGAGVTPPDIGPGLTPPDPEPGTGLASGGGGLAPGGPGLGSAGPGGLGSGGGLGGPGSVGTGGIGSGGLGAGGVGGVAPVAGGRGPSAGRVGGLGGARGAGLGGVGPVAAGVPGRGGIGGARGGAGGGRGLGGAVPGLVRSGSSSAGPMRSPMPGLTDPAAAMRQYGAGRGGVGMVPMAGGASVGHGEEPETDASSWLVDDDDPWGAGGDAPPGVLA